MQHIVWNLYQKAHRKLYEQIIFPLNHLLQTISESTTKNKLILASCSFKI